MIDYMHPMVLLQTEIGLENNNLYEARRNLEHHKDKLKEMFESTSLYKELKEKYFTATLEYIDEEETIVVVSFKSDGRRGFEAQTLNYNTQEIQDKLK